MDQIDFDNSGVSQDELEKKKFNLRRFVFDFFETIFLALILFLAINSISARIRIESISMQPTLYAGNFVIVNKLSYKFDQPTRGDIVVFRYPPDPDREPYIKRVIGLPGDTVEVKFGEVYVDGFVIEEPYISEKPNYNGSWIVPKNSIFVLGDNRNRSSDSHSWGMVPIDNIIGKALVVYWPPENWKLLDSSTAVASGR